MEITDVKKDKRGTIFKCKAGSEKFLIIFTKRGFLRAGETHNILQRTYLLKGSIMVITKENNENMERIYRDIGEIEIPANVPHYFEFLKDSIMIEFEDENLVTTYYPEYRKFVEESMK